jgi:hypothetical protein
MNYTITIAHYKGISQQPSTVELIRLGIPVTAIARFAVVRKRVTRRALARRVRENRN